LDADMLCPVEGSREDGMARRRRTYRDLSDSVARIEDRLGKFYVECGDLGLRDRVKRLADLLVEVKDLNVSSIRDAGVSARVARERLREYLQAHVGETIEGAELEVVGGISDYPRRIRELRVEHGFRIISGASKDPESGADLAPDQYVLLHRDRDALAAARWKVANRIRRSGGNVRQRILEFLKANVGHVVTTEDLAYVANDRSEFGRRTRELRTEEGYAVATRFTGRPDLKGGEYVLQSVDRVAEPHDRHIPHEVQVAVYARDRNACRVCRWAPGPGTVDHARYLELHHVVEHKNRGPNTAENLIVLCSRCHDELHAGKRSLPPKLRPPVPPPD
jgi:hypothetical protein